MFVKGDPILLMGDLNAVPYSWAYEQVRNKGLQDALWLSGFWGRTWPNGAGFVRFPFFRLDHIFVHSRIGINHRSATICFDTPFRSSGT